MDFRAGEIDHFTAAAAHQMGMGRYNSVKPFLPVHHSHGYDHSFLPENVDIPVDRSQRQVRDKRFEPLINPLGAGVAFCGPDDPQNGIPLAAVFSFPIHYK
jgi:hypothetical protein